MKEEQFDLNEIDDNKEIKSTNIEDESEDVGVFDVVAEESNVTEIEDTEDNIPEEKETTQENMEIKVDKAENKKVFLMVGWLLAVVLAIVIILFFVKKSNEATPVSDIKELGVKDYFLTNELMVESRAGDYFIASDIHSNHVVIDKDSNVLIDFGHDYVFCIEQFGFYVFEVNEVAYLYDSDLKKISTADEIGIINDIVDGKVYFSVRNGEKFTLYDESYNEIPISGGFTGGHVNNGKLYSGEKIFDLSSGNKIGTYDGTNTDGEKYFYVEYSSNKVGLVLAGSSEEMEFDKFEYIADKFVFTKGDTKFVLDDSGNEVSEDSIYIKKINDDYYFDSSSCNKVGGYILKDKDNKALYDKCAYEYQVSSLDKGVFAVYFDDKTIIKNLNGKEYVVDGEIELSNGYFILNDGSKNGIVDYDDNYIETELSKKALGLGYLGGDKYYVKVNNKYVVTDNNFEKEYGEYDDISCYSGKFEYCVVEKDKMYGLYMYGEEVVVPGYLGYRVEEQDKYIYFNQVLGSLVLEFGMTDRRLSSDDIEYLEENLGADLDVSKIIDDYGLNDIKDIIWDNEKLFRKFAYIVENNTNLSDYSSYVMDQFPLLIEYKDYLEESWFLYNLKDLSIEESNTLDTPNAAGTYMNNGIKLRIVTDKVVYHEILHFLDDKFDRSEASFYYTCGDKIYSTTEYDYLKDKSGCEILQIIEARFITEYGAEKYASMHFNDNGVDTYFYAGYVYENLNYIFKNNIMEDIFWSADSDYKLFELLVLETGVDYEIYRDFLAYADILRDFNSPNYSMALKEVSDYLIDIYKVKYPNQKWYEDKEFVFNISMLSGLTPLNSRYANEYDKMAYFSKIYDLPTITDPNVYKYPIQNSIHMYFDNGDAYYIRAYKSDGIYSSENGYIKVDYDFENEKVNSYEFFKANLAY